MKEEIVGNHRFLVYELSAEETLDLVILRMIQQNAVRGLLTVTFLQKDEQQILKYDCTGMTALADFIKNMHDSMMMVSLLTDLAGILLEAEEYMIEEAAFLFGMDTVFVTPEGNAGLVCLPVEGRQEMDFCQFCSRMLTVSADAGMGQGLLAQIHNCLSGEQFSKQEFLRMLEQLELQSAISSPRTVPVRQEPVVLGKKERVFQAEKGQPETARKIPVILSRKNKKEAGKIRGYLYRKSPEEKILIDKEQFQIGKGSQQTDYRIRGNSFVSRQHAKITREGDTFYITDLHSLNHTYVGGKKLDGGQMVALEDQVTVRLANEEFVFMIREE